MRRLYTSYSEPGQGAVYREIADCPDGAACGVCINDAPVGIISGIGCTPDFPVKDNEYGKLPTTFPADVEIDPEPFDVRLSLLDGISYDNGYPDMWGLLEPLPALQDTVLEEDCYCAGDGIDKPGLTTGRPAFPIVAPLNFFWFPALDIPDALTVREINPDTTLPGDCCPTDLTDYIRAEIIGNEIQLEHVKKGDYEEIYRTGDTDVTFQARAGFPKWCCVENECKTSAGEGLDDPEHVLKWLHFPRWPSIARDPYDETTPEEPLGIVPVVVDIQCDPATGVLHVYHANLVVHDGILAAVQWDVEEPREIPGYGDPAVAPTNPLDIPINQDYQGSEIYDDTVFKATEDPLLGEFCDENCAQAMANIFRPEEACEPGCPQDDVLCDPDDFLAFSGTGFGDTPGEANTAAAAAMQAAADADPDCIQIQLIWICYTVYNPMTENYVAEVKGCCSI
jgi:hypothetical protein